MPPKHIIIISTMLIIAFGIFVTSWILSHRISNVDNNEEMVSNVTKTSDMPSRISTLRKEKEPVVKKETQADDEIQKISDAVDYNQNEEWFKESLDRTESQNEDTSQTEENTAMYTALRKPFEQLHSLYAQLDLIHDELKDMQRTGRALRIVNGVIEMSEYFQKLDEKDAIGRQVLETAKEAQKIAPNAIEIIESSIENISADPRRSSPKRIRYDIKISRQQLETSLGNIPEDWEASFPDENMSVVIHEDENFSWLEWYRENERKRLAGQASQNR